MHLDPAILRNFARICPLSYKALCGRRYLLPDKYQAFYSNQGQGLQRRAVVLLGSALAPDEDSFPRRAELLNLLVALRYDLPTLFLDPDLAEALLRTDLPADFRTEDVCWPWPGFRLMLPIGLHLGDKDGEARAEVQYADICLCEQDDVIRLDQKLLDDLYGGLRTLGCKVNGYLSHGFTHPNAAEVYVSGLTLSDETVTFVHEWDSGVLRELVKLNNTGERPKSERIRCLAFNTLILLSQYPLRIDLPPLKLVRPSKLALRVRFPLPDPSGF